MGVMEHFLLLVPDPLPGCIFMRHIIFALFTVYSAFQHFFFTQIFVFYFIYHKKEISNGEKIFWLKSIRRQQLTSKEKKCTNIIFSRPISCKLVLNIKSKCLWVLGYIKMVIVVSFYTAGEGKHVIKETVTWCRKCETVSMYTVESRLMGVSNEEEAQGADSPRPLRAAKACRNQLNEKNIYIP